MKRIKVEAGKYRYPAVLQKRNMVQNGYGETIQDWITVANIRCGVQPISGREFFDKEAVNAEITHRITMRYQRNLVTPDMRIIYDNRTFMITSIIDIQEMHKELQLMCKELILNE